MKILYLLLTYFFIIGCNHSLKDENIISVDEFEKSKQLNESELEKQAQRFNELNAGDTMYVNDAEALQDYINHKRDRIDFGKFTGKKFIIESTFNDKEINGNIIQTNNETTQHIFDFKNRIVTLKSPLNGKWVYFKFPMNGFYVQSGLKATTYVIKVNELGVKEIWFSLDIPNLGYDYDDGSRIACYDLTQLY